MALIGAYGRMTTKPAMIVRAGEGAKEYPDPYDSSLMVTFEDEGWATFEGFVWPNGINFWSRMQAAIRVVNRMTGLPVRWMRRSANPHWMHQIAGVNGGKIIMAKQPIDNISVIFNADGTLNESKGMSGLTHALHQIKEGHYSIGNGKASQTTNGKVTSISISFDRTEK